MTTSDLISYNFINNKKNVAFNFETISELPKDRWKELLPYLKEAFTIEKADDGSLKEIVVSDGVLYCLNDWLDLTLTEFSISNVEVLEVITEVLRSLRNCISNFHGKQYLVENTKFLATCDILFLKLIDTDKNNLCLKILLQLLINLVSSYKESTENIYRIFHEKIKLCLKNGIHVYEASALLYNISLTVSVNDKEVLDLIFDIYNADDQNEFPTFFLENSVSKDYFWNLYQHLKRHNRITVLEILRHIQLKQNAFNLPSAGLEVLTNIFLNSTNTVFQIEQEDDMKIYEVSIVLEILASLSSDEDYLQKLQNKKEILVNAVQKLSEFTTDSELNEHPAFGFKADLVRLIGNLCWKNKELQDLARTAELIPVVMDCCNMDARNPFIIQWAILAVRNLCEHNEENQKLIASLHQEGVISSEVLNEMGITLHSDGDNQLKIVSLDSLNN